MSSTSQAARPETPRPWPFVVQQVSWLVQAQRTMKIVAVATTMLASVGCASIDAGYCVSDEGWVFKPSREQTANFNRAHGLPVDLFPKENRNGK